MASVVFGLFKSDKKQETPRFLPGPPVKVKKKKKKSGAPDMDAIADEHMKLDAYQDIVDKYGVDLHVSEELAEDLPNQDEDDGYYTHLEKQMYERPRPNCRMESPAIVWQRGGLLGSGAFGKVYLGLDLYSGKLLAVKQISLEGQQTAREVAAVQQEVMLLRGLRHENIVQYYGTSVEDSILNIFLEYVPCGSISTLLQKFGAFTEQVIQVYTKQILTGLEYLHSHQIVHRDIKGANILVDNTGIIKLADFGASKTIEGLKTRTGSLSGIKGTPFYMAPEVIKQMKHGRQADIWSVGCTVIEMATGNPPWGPFTDHVSALFIIGSSNSPPPIPAGLSREANDFLANCFRLDPSKRPSAMRLLDHAFVSNIMPSRSSSENSTPQTRRSPAMSRSPSRDSIHSMSMSEKLADMKLRRVSLSVEKGERPLIMAASAASRVRRLNESATSLPSDNDSIISPRHETPLTSTSDDVAPDEPVLRVSRIDPLTSSSASST